MFKKYLTLILTFLILNISLGSVAFAETKAEKEAKFAEKVRVNVANSDYLWINNFCKIWNY